MAQPADLKDHYAVLGVAPTATADEIKLAYRDAAKRLHPDRSGNSDGEQFRELTQAYETLRDARRRMRYDASRVDSRRPGRRKPASTARAASSTDKTSHTKRQPPREATAPKRFPSARVMTLVSAALAAALLIALGLLWQSQAQSDQRIAGLDEAILRAEAAEADLAEIRARYRASTFMALEEALARGRSVPGTADGQHSFLAEISFADGSFALEDRITAEIDRAVLGLADIISAIPPAADWLILIEGHSGEAASVSGVSVAAWELSLMRLGTVTDYLTSQGLPPERLAVRFQAGFQLINRPSSGNNRIEIKLLCCTT